MKRAEIAIFIFRRDLRIDDNTGLLKLLARYNCPILPVFIFNPNQVTKNSFYSKNSAEFMVQSLKELNISMQDSLCYFYGKDTEVLDSILKFFDILAIGYNEDYTPFAKERDSTLKTWCLEKSIDTISCQDYCLFPWDLIGPYRVFTPFYNKCLQFAKDIPAPIVFTHKKLTWADKKPIKKLLLKDIDQFYHYESNLNIAVKGGRTNALAILSRIRSGEFGKYKPDSFKTTQLSAYIKFGCVSIREVFYAMKQMGIKHELTRQLFWKEYYAGIVYYNPQVLQGEALKNYKINWPNKLDWYNAWCKGETGFPIVDAAMRQLNATGWMPNRCRMIVASFLVKDMLCDWKLGEAYFASKLVDYDPASNGCGWQGMASVGADASQPYFRILNPWIQLAKFDADTKYVRKWIHELARVESEDILNWDTAYKKYKNIKYPPPVLDHSMQAKKFIAIFSRNFL
jgi:deoxyribodipyrimidine photo-lyase